MSQSDDMQEADLGLGDGLKPGAVTILSSEAQNSDESNLLSKVSYNSDENNHSGCSCSGGSDDEFELTLMPIKQIHDLKSQYSNLVPKHSSRSHETFSNNNEENLIYDDRYFGPNLDKKSNSSTSCENPYTHAGKESKRQNDEVKPEFPTYADVSYGTSIRQQKELFNQNIEEIRKKMTVSLSNTNTTSAKDKVKAENHKPKKKRTCEEIAMKLAETLQEVEDLKMELETCEQRLESKYKAIDILRKQAEEAQKQLRFTERTSKETSLKLSQEICDLQFQVEQQENSLLDSQEVWAHRFDRMCQENKSLMNTLESRTEELRKITAQKMAVDRENDELLALLDIQERAKYEKTKSVSSEENYCSFSTTELAVLGACRCRISTPDPCTCAHAAANLKKEIVKMKEELLLYKSRRDEAYHTVDAYRKAFEEQLQRNKSLTLQLANISSGRGSTGNLTSTSKAKLALKWLIGSLNDEEIADDASSMVPGQTMSEYELITFLTEMVNEKKEVLAHQKLAAQILADRVKVLEEKLLNYEKDNSEVFT